MFDVVNGLHSQGHQVTVFAINTLKHFQQKNVLDGIAKLETVQLDTSLSYFNAFLNLFSARPYNFERFISKKVDNELIKLITSHSFDCIQIEGAQVAYYIDTIRKHTKTPVLLRAHNLEYKIWEGLSRNELNPIKKWYLSNLSKKIKRYERTYLDKFDAVVAITMEDVKLIKLLGCSSRIECIPAGVDLTRFKRDGNIVSKSNSALILGALNWLPNLEGLNWFLKFVWREVIKACPDFTLHVAGKDTPKDLVKLKLPGLHVHGFVDSASDFMQSYDIMLVPLLSGSGMRIKIIEGMVLGKCILSTSTGAEGIDCKEGENILIEDRAEKWIEILKAYYRKEINYVQLGESARKHASLVYDNQNIIRKFVQLYKSLD